MIYVPLFRASYLVAVLAVLGGLGLSAAGCGLDPSGEVHGTALRTTVYVQPGSPPQVSAWEGDIVEAWVPGPSGYTTFSGTIDSAGQFRIAGVPPGPYWLVFPNEASTSSEAAKMFVWTQARELDLSWQELGPELAGETVPAGGVITGLSPAEADDHIFLAPSSGSWAASWGPRPLGAEQATIELPGRHRVRPGVRLSAQQIRRSQQGSLTGDTIVKYGEVAVTQGASSTPNIALTDPPARQLGFQVDHGGFLRQLGPTPPSGVAVKRYLDFELLASSVENEGHSRLPSLVRLSSTVEDSQNPDTSVIRYGDPYPPDAPRIYELRYGAYYPCTAQDKESRCGSQVYVRGPLSELAAATVRPRLSRPQALSIDGNDAMTTTEVGPNPTVRWQVPESGQVSTYVLTLIRIVPQPSGTPTEERAGMFITAKNEVTLLPGALKPGGRYYFKLRAFGGLGIDATVAPVRASLQNPPAESTIWSAPFTVNAVR